MNREQRRAKEKADRKETKSSWPNGECGVPPSIEGLLSAGTKFSIAGLRRYKDGTYTTKCKPGNETVWESTGVTIGR